MNENQYRIWRSPYSRFGGLNSLRPDDTTDETVTAVDCYTDDVLREIAENGFNAIWLHSVLANITHLDIFPEFGKPCGTAYQESFDSDQPGGKIRDQGISLLSAGKERGGGKPRILEPAFRMRRTTGEGD